jgi:rhodanese-related sulfurtransferase
MSPHFARLAKEVYGYKNVKYMVAGHMSWQQAMYPYYTEPEFLKMAQDEGISHVLVDVRSPEKARQAHIKGAVNYPVSKLNELFDALPEDTKNTRIIYYSDNEKEAVLAHQSMRVNGYENGYVLNGGLAAWKAKGYAVVKDQLKTEIPDKLPSTPLPGSITIAQYEELVHNRPAETIIVDVRSPGEVMKGVVPGALTIPIDTFERRLSELPRDKKYVIQCAAGNRALQGWRVLKDHGYKDVLWVDGPVNKFSKGLLQAYGK